MKVSVLSVCLCAFLWACAPPEPTVVEVVLPLPSAPVSQVKAQTQSKIDISVAVPTPSAVLPTSTPTSVANSTPQPVRASSPPSVPTPSPPPQPTPEPTPVPTPTPGPVFTQFSINAPATNSFAPLDTLQILAHAQYSDGSQRSVLWRSLTPQTASVTPEGQVRFLSEGSVTLEVSDTEASDQVQTLNFQVAKQAHSFQGHILFARNEDLFLLSGSNTQETQLTTSGESVEKRFPHLSWDGLKAVYRTQGKQLVLGETSQFSNAQTLTELDPNQAEPFGLFGSDGSLYLQGFGEPLYGSGGYRVWQHIDQQSPVMLTDKTGPLSYFAGVAGDGTLAYEYGGQLFVLKPGAEKLPLGSGYNPSLPKNQTPVFMVFQIKSQIFVVDLLTLERQYLVDGTYPVMSPDQSQVLFIGEVAGQKDLMLINRDGTGLRNLTQTPFDNENTPDWSL